MDDQNDVGKAEKNPSDERVESPLTAQVDRASALATFQIATQCSDHRDERIAESDLGEAVYYGDNGADEFESVAVFRAVNGGFIVAAESSDYTGHGCQCSGSAEQFDSLDNALRLGLSDSEAELCGASEDRAAAIARFDRLDAPEAGRGELAR